MNLVSVIIPHAGGVEILDACLDSLRKQTAAIELIIVVNGTTEEVNSSVVSDFIGNQVLHYSERIGFAAACNRGVEAASGEFVFLLNNDAIVNSDTIELLCDFMSSTPKAAACQPKLLSSLRNGYFDYSSAAGGEIDRFGFPFAHGRVFDTVEKDSGQFEAVSRVFWGAGAALMIRRKVYLDSGGLAERFFAHMEEIDLCWRFHLMGYAVYTVPGAVAYHAGAVTIRDDSFIKIYLNHRNSLAMMLRNYSIGSLFRYMPVRDLLDWVAAIRAVFQLDLMRFLAVLRAKCWIWYSLHYLIISRRKVQRLRTVREEIIIDLMYPRSVVWDYFVLNRRTWDKLNESWKRHLR